MKLQFLPIGWWEMSQNKKDEPNLLAHLYIYSFVAPFGNVFPDVKGAIQMLTPNSSPYLGQRVAYRREKLGLSQKELAARVGVNEKYICALEKGGAVA